MNIFIRMDEEPHTLYIIIECRFMKRGLVFVVIGLNFCPFVEEVPDHLHTRVPTDCCQVERGVEKLVGTCHTGT